LQKLSNIAGRSLGIDNAVMRSIRPYWDLTRLSHHAPELAPFAVWLSWAQLITWGSVFYTFSLIMGPVERELGLSRADASLGFSLALLADGLMAYAIGRWIDRGHERRVMTWGSAWVGMCLWAHSFIDSLAGFYAVWLGLGLGMSATLYAPVFAVVTRRFPNDFRRAIIIMTFLGGLASTVFIPLSSWLIQSLGWRHALWVLALMQWLICMPLHAWLLQGAAPQKVAAIAAKSTDPLVDSDSHASPSSSTVSLRVHLKRAPFWLLAGFMLMTAIVSSALPAHMVSLLEEAHLSPAWVIAIPAAIGAIQVLGRFLLFLFEKHLDVHAANKWIPCLVPLGLVCLVVGGLAPWAALLFVTLYGLGNGLNTIVKGTAMAQYVSRDHVGQLNGVLGVPLALGRAVAPWALGLMWTPEVGYTNGLRCLLLAGVLGVACLWWAQKRAHLAHTKGLTN
jgi:MFS family permease